jgi:hypothetical protein
MKFTGLQLAIASTLLLTVHISAEPVIQRYKVIQQQNSTRDLVQVQTAHLFMEMDYQLDRDIKHEAVDALSEMSDDPGFHPYALAAAMEKHPEQFTAANKHAVDIE